MERKDIIFDGVMNVPDDSMAQDGQLSLSVNAIKHNGSVQPVEKGTPVRFDDKYEDGELVEEGQPIDIKTYERLEYVHHLPDTDEERFIVLSSKEEIILNRDSLTLNVGDWFPLDAFVIPIGENYPSFAWRSDNEGIASVDENGKVTANNVGTCTITCRFADEASAEATCKVKVVQYVTSITLYPQTTEQSRQTILVNHWFQITTKVKPNSANRDLIWTSSNESIAHVSQSGVVTGISVGDCFISAQAADGGGASAIMYVSVVASTTTTIEFDKYESTIESTGEDAITATVRTDGETVPSVTWTSDNENVATVTEVSGAGVSISQEESGTRVSVALVNAVGVGECNIVATVDGYEDVSAKCFVKVVGTKYVTSIEVLPSTLRLKEGQIRSLSANVLPEDAENTDVVWSSNHPDIASVNEDGMVSANKVGTCRITCMAADGSDVSATCDVTVEELDYVDLGLKHGTLWAKQNVGMDDRTNYGSFCNKNYGAYFAWGEGLPRRNNEEFSWKNYRLCKETENSIFRYNSDDKSLSLQSGLEGEQFDDDAAHCSWGDMIDGGGRWMMPNKAQFDELIDDNYTTKEWKKQNGVYGVLLTSRIYEGRSIFLPAGGGYSYDRTKPQPSEVGEWCKYWSSDRDSTNQKRAYRLSAYVDTETGELQMRTESTTKKGEAVERCYGYLIRPIFVPKQPNPRPLPKPKPSGGGGSGQVDVTFTLTDKGSRIVLEGKLDEGRTLVMRLTYDDNSWEYASVRFTKSNTYNLSTRLNTASRKLRKANVRSYDDESVVLNVTWIIKNEDPYYYGTVGNWDTIQPTMRGLRLAAPSPTRGGGGGTSDNVSTEVYVGSNATTGQASGSTYLFWFNKKNGTRKYIAGISSAIREITSVKNVLIISTDAGLYFARNTGQEYQWLGQLPELPCVTPYLETTIKADTQYPARELTTDYFDTSGKTTYEYGKRYTPSSSDKEEIFTILSAHHGQILDGIHKEGCFAFPFQVRVAYRMFDGTYISVSRPYPMCPSTTYLPLSLISIEPNEQAKLHINVLMAASRLNMKINGYIDDAWKDIITGFDIFVSSEVEDYTADESGDSIEWIDTGDEFYNKEDVSRYIPYHFSVSANGNDLFKKDNYIDFEKVNDTEDTITKESVTMSANETITIDDDEYAYTETETRTVYAFKKSDIDNNKITINRSKWSDSLKSAGAVLTTESEDFTIEYMLLYDLLNKYFEIEEIDASQYYFVPLKQSLLQYQIGNVTKVTSIKANEAINDAFKITINPTAINFFDYGSSNTDVISMGSSYFFYKDSYDYYDRLKKSKFFTVYVCTTDVSGNPFQVYLSASAHSVGFSGKQILQQGDLFYEHFREKYGSQIDNYTIVSSIISRPNSPVIPTMGIKAAYGNVTYSEYHIYIGYNINGTIVSNVDLDKTFCGFLKTRRTTGDSVEKAFRNQGEFWRIDSVNFEDIKGRTTYPVSISENDIEKLNKHDLETLSSQKMLDTSVVNRYAFNCSDLFTYNSRLNVVIDKQELETPDYADNLYMGVEKGVEQQQIDIKYAVEVVKNGITRIVPVPQNQSDSTYDNALRYFFYPNKNATRLLELKNDTTIVQETFIIELDEIIVGGGLTQQPMGEGEKYVFNIDCSTHGSKINTYTLTQHEAIFGSYAFNDWELLKPVSEMGITKELVIGEISAEDSSISQYIVLNKDEIFEKFKEQIENNPAFSTFLPRNFSVSDIGTTIEVPETQNDTTELAEKIQVGYNKQFHVGNKILQSDVENPFAFLNKGVVQLGCETIHRICATSRPISQGQKGQHPLYAFTDEGIYALAVDAYGEYTKADLVSPEVITSGNVHQVEQSVLFATSKGMMSISENDLVCLSAKIEGHNHAEGLVAIDNVKDALGLEYVGSLGFHAKDWFTSAELVYDAKNGLIYIFQEPLPDSTGWHDINLGLVYDVSEGVWGMYENKLLYGVNSYTDALAVELTDRRGSGVVVNMSEPLNRHEQTYKSLLLTRPLKFGEKDEYKTMEDIILRGAQGTNKGMLVIWASNDLEHWKVIGSSKNYKWRNYSGTPYKYFRIGVLMNEWQEGDSITGASVDITTRLTNKLR